MILNSTILTNTIIHSILEHFLLIIFLLYWNNSAKITSSQIGTKMAEQKDVLSLPFARAPDHNQLLDNHQQEDTGTHQKRYPTSKDKGETTVRQYEGRSHSKIKSHNCWVGDSQTGEHLYHRSPPTGVKVLSPTSGFPTWGSGNGRRNSQRIRL